MMKIIKYSLISKINIGDVFISDCIKYIDRRSGGNTIECQDIVFADFDMESRISNAKPTTSFYKVKSRSRLSSFAVMLIKILIFELRHRKKIVDQIKSSECVFIGGGNIISESNGSDLFYRICAIADIAKSHRRKLIVYGVGLGPFEFSYSKRLKKLINSSDIFCVRDVKSKSICDEVNPNKEILTILDPAFVVSDMYPAIDTPKKYIGLNFMNFKRLVKNSVYDVDLVVDNLVRLNNHYKLPYKIINTSFGEDLSLSIIIKEKLENRGINLEILNIKTLTDLPYAYSDLNFFIGSRMHSSIFAMSYNIPTLIYSWHPKIEFTYDYLFGKNKYGVLLTSENFDCEEIVQKMGAYEINLPQVISDEKLKIYKDYEKIIGYTN